MSLRYVGPFEILECIRPVAYRLALPPSLSGIRDVFHVSMLWKYMDDPSYILEYDSLKINADLAYKEVLVQILDEKDRAAKPENIFNNGVMVKSCYGRSNLGT